VLTNDEGAGTKMHTNIKLPKYLSTNYQTPHI